MKVTPWFSPKVKPARPGVYQMDASKEWYRLFNGCWYFGAPSPYDAAASKQKLRKPFDLVGWRGLAVKP